MNDERSASTFEDHNDIDLMIRVAESLVENRDDTRLMDLAEKAHTQSQTVDYQYGIAASLCLKSEAYLLQNQMEPAITHYEEALRISRQLNNLTLESATLWGLIRAHLKLSDFATVIELCQRRLALCETLGTHADEARTLNMIGIVHDKRGMTRESVPYFERALQLYRKLDDEHGIARVAINMTRIYCTMNVLDKAHEYGELALHLAEKLNEHDGMSRASGHLAYISQKNGDYEAAYRYLTQAWHHAEQARPLDQIIALIHHIDLYLHLGHGERAIPYAEDALFLANQINSTSHQMDIHHALAKAHRLSGDYETALDHFERYDTLRTQFYDEENERNVNNLEVLHRTETARRESQFYQSRTQELERLREQDQQYFQQLSQMKDDLLSTASHDLKNPLGIIKTSIDVIKRVGGVRDERSIRHIRIIEGQVRRMRALITNLLDLARLETDNPSQYESLNIRLLIQQALFDFQPEIQRKRIKITATVTPDDLVAPLDPTQIRQALDNLLANAVKYTPNDGHVSVTVEGGAQTFTIQIADSGIGIPGEDLPYIFERFYRVQGDIRTTYEGTGLGLAIVKSIIDRHQGTIRVDSEENEGTVFTITLPIYRGMSDENSAPA